MAFYQPGSAEPDASLHGLQDLQDLSNLDDLNALFLPQMAPSGQQLPLPAFDSRTYFSNSDSHAAAASPSLLLATDTPCTTARPADTRHNQQNLLSPAPTPTYGSFPPLLSPPPVYPSPAARTGYRDRPLVLSPPYAPGRTPLPSVEMDPCSLDTRRRWDRDRQDHHDLDHQNHQANANENETETETETENGPLPADPNDWRARLRYCEKARNKSALDACMVRLLDFPEGLSDREMKERRAANLRLDRVREKRLKDRNNEAAKRSRQRKTERIETAEQRVAQLAEECDRLREANDGLRRRNVRLQEWLRRLEQRGGVRGPVAGDGGDDADADADADADFNSNVHVDAEAEAEADPVRVLDTIVAATDADDRVMDEW